MALNTHESTLTTPLRRFTEDSLASSVTFREVGWAHGEATVWAVERAGSTIAFLKRHRQTEKFAAELHAYREYVPVLGESAPRLIGVHGGDEPALLLSALSGDIVSDVTWPADIEYVQHVRAAQLLRLLHTLPVEEAQRCQVETKTRASLGYWMPRARAYLPIEVIDWAIEHVEAGMAQAPPICVCHKDFSPRNWIATRDGQIGLIDFERTCIDFQYLDWSRLWMREWLRRPDLKDAFFTGYGVIDASWELTMQRLMTLHAVAGVAWAIEHNDPAFAQENHALVKRLRRCSTSP